MNISDRLRALPFAARLACVFFAVFALLAIDMVRREAAPPPARAIWTGHGTPSGNTRLVVNAFGRLPMPPDTPSAHGSSLLAMPADSPSVVSAFWFAGQRESAPDVQIAESHFERATQQWSPARFIVNRHDMGRALGFGLRRLGNPVAWLDAQGKMHMFVVATGLGGWAAGRILHLRQTDDGRDPEKLTLAEPRVLALSWLWNTSFLVRGSPQPLADGGMVLPAYFELGIKYPVALRFDAQGNFKGMARVSSRRDLLQPTLVALSESRWLALMRDQSRTARVGAALTEDGGATWRDLPDLSVMNPNSSIAAMALKPGDYMLAHNSSPNARHVLDLSRSSNGLDWSLAHTLARGTDPEEYSYPSMTWAGDALWVSHTHHRKSIAWQRLVLETAP